MLRKFLALTAISLAIASFVMAAPDAEARRHSSSHSSSHSSHSASHSSHSSSHSSHSSSLHTSSRGSSSRRHHGRDTDSVASSRHHGHSTETALSSRHHGRHHAETLAHHRGHSHGHSAAPKAAAKPRYAYPLEMFLSSPPEFDQTAFDEITALHIRKDFDKGLAERYKATDLVRAGVANYHPIHGGVFNRREPVKYIIVHSTETGPPVSATRVIDAWSSLGRRHAGAQFVVERDGKIYLACDPELATVHVNIFKTLPGINNDNSIGIEMNHTGHQNYPQEQREAVKRLVSYLQDRYHVTNENVITHRYAQQGDHTDPVAFDFDDFLAQKDDFHNRALAMKRDSAPPVVPVSTPAAVETAASPVVPTATPVVPTATPPSVAPPIETAASPELPPKAPDVTAPTTALTPKRTETGVQFGAPLPGPPALRKEIEMPASAVDAERSQDAKLENELEPMQQVP